MKKYLVSSLLKKVFSTKGDEVLRTIRLNMRRENKLINEEYELKNNNFKFSDIMQIKLPGDHRLSLNDEDIEEIFQNKKGSPYAFMVLSLLYSKYKWNTAVIHQDHIHAISGFSKVKLGILGLSKTEIEEWQDLADQLPNLELLLGNENETKNDMPFASWLILQTNKNEYIRTNYIPITSYDLKDFIDFFTKRKEILKTEIKKILI